MQLEAFAHLAGEVVTRLSPPTNRTERRNLVRLYALVTKVADDAIAAVRHGDALISALSAHRRSAGPAGLPPSRTPSRGEKPARRRPEVSCTSPQDRLIKLATPLSRQR